MSLTNKQNINIAIKYDGKFPNLCSGHLVVYINNLEYDFGDHALSSGGYVTFDDNWSEDVGEGQWSVVFPKKFPEEHKKDVIDKINEEIPLGCCGGCV